MSILAPSLKPLLRNKLFEASNVAKRRSLDVIELYFMEASPQCRRYAERMLNCSNDITIVVDDNIDSLTFGRTTFENARWCCVRHCPFCQLGRARKLRAKFLKCFNVVTCAGLEFIFLTLTVRNVPVNKLRLAIKEMNKAWKRLTERAGFPAQGFLRSFEVTMQHDRVAADGRGKKSSGAASRSEDGFLMAHPHLHVVLCMKPGYYEFNFKTKDWWIDEWQSCLRVDYRPSISIKKIDTEENLITSLLETLKYTTKPGDFALPERESGKAFPKDSVAGEWLYALTRELDGVRAMSVGGNIAKFCKQSDIDAINNTSQLDDELTQIGRRFSLAWNDKRKIFDVLSGHVTIETYGGGIFNSPFIKVVRLQGPQENYFSGMS
jgi:plasmid rolling circle replication initiator protein Rep